VTLTKKHQAHTGIFGFRTCKSKIIVDRYLLIEAVAVLMIAA